MKILFLAISLTLILTIVNGGRMKIKGKKIQPGLMGSPNFTPIRSNQGQDKKIISIGQFENISSGKYSPISKAMSEVVFVKAVPSEQSLPQHEAFVKKQSEDVKDYVEHINTKICATLDKIAAQSSISVKQKTLLLKIGDYLRALLNKKYELENLNLSKQDIIDIKTKLSTATQKLDRIYNQHKKSKEDSENHEDLEKEDIEASIEHLNQHKVMSSTSLANLLGHHDSDAIKLLIKEITDIKEKAITNDKVQTLFEINDLQTKMKKDYPDIYTNVLLRIENLKHFVEQGEFDKIERSANALEESFARLVVVGKVSKYTKEIDSGHHEIQSTFDKSTSKDDSKETAKEEVQNLEKAEMEAESAILKVKDAIEKLTKTHQNEIITSVEKGLSDEDKAELKMKVDLKTNKLLKDADILQKAIEKSDISVIKAKVVEVENDTQPSALENVKNESVSGLIEAAQKGIEESDKAPKSEENVEDFIGKFKANIDSMVGSIKEGQHVDFKEFFAGVKSNLLLGIAEVSKSEMEELAEENKPHIENVYGKCGKDLVEALQIVFINIIDDLDKLDIEVSKKKELVHVTEGSASASAETHESDKSKISIAVGILKNAVVNLEGISKSKNLEKLCSDPWEEKENKLSKKDDTKKTDAEVENAVKTAKVIEIPQSTQDLKSSSNVSQEKVSPSTSQPNPVEVAKPKVDERTETSQKHNKKNIRKTKL